MLPVNLPKPRLLSLQPIHNHKELQLRQSRGDLAAIGGREQWVETLAEITIHFAYVHQLEGTQNVVTWDIEFRQRVVGEVVFGRRRRAPHGLLEANEDVE